jgi:hypothetical protein
MTANNDLDQQLNSFLREGPTELPYQSFDAVRSRTEQTRQRAFLGPWRTPTMNKSVVLSLSAAAVIVVGIFIGAQLFGQANLGGPIATPTATPTATPIATPTTTPELTPTADGSLAVGSSHVLWDATNGESDVCCLGMKITVAIPASGWFGDPKGGILIKDNNADAPDGAGLIVFARVNDLLVGLGDVYVYGDPCHWESTKPDLPVTTVDEAIAALSGQASREPSAPEDVTLDGYHGKSITLHVPGGAVFSECDQGEFRTLTEGEDSARYAQDPGQIDLIWVLDVEGELAIFDVGYYDGTPPSVLDEVAAIVESATIYYTP